MITTLQFKVKQTLGVLGGITVMLVNQGYRIKKQSMKTPKGEMYALIQMTVETDLLISHTNFEEMKSIVPEILDIRSLTPKEGQVSPAVEVVDENLLRSYFRQINAEYPNITHVLRKIDSNLNASNRDSVMGQLGKACGRKDYKSQYSLGGLLNLDKTLQRVLLTSLKTLFKVELEEHTFKISGCPLCFDYQMTQPNCVFITEYIQGFLDSVPNLPVVSVSQTHCKAMQHSHCVFVVRSAID